MNNTKHDKGSDRSVLQYVARYDQNITYVYPDSTKNFITNKIKIIFLKSNDKMSGKKVLRLGSPIKIVFLKLKSKMY